jgi:hypothetical protein
MKRLAILFLIISGMTAGVSAKTVYGLPKYESIQKLFLTPDGKTLYVELLNQYMVTILKNGEKFGEHNLSKNSFYSENGKSIGWILDNENTKKEEVYIDGKKVADVDFCCLMYFTPDGSSWGYPFEKDEKNYYQIGNDKFGPFKFGACIFFSADNQHVGYNYSMAEYEEYVVIDGKKFGPYEEALGPYFSVNGSFAAYIYMKNWEHFIDINGKTYDVYQEGYIPSYSPDGKRFAFTYLKGGKYYANIDGKSEGGYGDIQTVSFSADSSQYGYAYKKALQKFNMKVGKKDYGPYDSAYSLYYSLNGKDFGFAYKKGGKIVKNEYGTKVIAGGKWYMNITGKDYGPYDGLLYRNDNPVRFSGDHWGFLYGAECVQPEGEVFSQPGISDFEGGKWYVCIDGNTYGGYPWMDFCFTPDGNAMIAYIDGQTAVVETVELK